MSSAAADNSILNIFEYYQGWSDPLLLKAPFWTVDTLFYAVPKQNIDLQFSLSIFKKINWKKFDESTGVPSLSKTVINSVGASVPSYEE